MWQISFSRSIILIIIIARGRCEYIDAVDLKKDNISIPSDKIVTKDYYRSVNGAVKVSSHPRGYICQVKSCVVFSCQPDKLIRNFAVNITLYNGKKVDVIEINKFAVDAIFEILCNVLEDKDTDEQVPGQWQLFENGTLRDLANGSMPQMEENCLISLNISNDYYEHMTQLLNTAIESKTTQNQTIDLPSVIRVVSVFCMVITIVVYIYLPKFNSIYSQCCVCYFISLSLGHLILCAESLYRDGWPSKLVCYMIGYCKHYTVMAVFLWLLVINYILWKTFKNIEIEWKIGMRSYHIFVWSTAAILSVITGSVKGTFIVMECIDKYLVWQPGNDRHYCWYLGENWYAVLVFNGPICLVTIINLTLSIITARHIYVVKRDSDFVWNSPESQKKTTTNLADFSMFFRLFAIAGVIWLLEMLDMLSTLLEINIKSIEILTDIILSAQGILLFFATIWKKDVLKSLSERMAANKPIQTSTS